MADEATGQAPLRTSKETVPVENFLSLSPADQDADLAIERSKLTMGTDEEPLETAPSEQPKKESTDSSKEQPADSKADDESAVEPEKSDNQDKDKVQTELESLKRKVDEQSRQFKELQADYTRKAQELAEMKKQSQESAKTPEDREQEARLAQMEKDNPDAVALIRKQIEAALKDKISPVEEQVSSFQKRTYQDTLAKEFAEFQKGPYAELESDVRDMIERAESTFENDPAVFSKFMQSNRSLMKDIVAALRDTHGDDKMAEMYTKWKARNSSSASPKKEVAKAEIGGAPSSSKSLGKKTKLEEYSDDEFKTLPLDEMARLLPRA